MRNIRIGKRPATGRPPRRRIRHRRVIGPAGTLLREDVLPPEVGRRPLENLILCFQLAVTPAQLDQFLRLRAGEPTVAAVVVGVAWAVQFRRHDSEICNSFASTTTGLSPVRANATARCRNSAGCGAGIDDILTGSRRPPHPSCTPCAVRMATQPSPSPSGYRERPATTSAARIDHLPRHDHASAHPPTRSHRRTPPRIRTRRLCRTDEIVGTHRALPAPPVTHPPLTHTVVRATSSDVDVEGPERPSAPVSRHGRPVRATTGHDCR
jgi:hypothetical protein